MTQLTWGDSGKHLYEVGIDRGVLYPETGPGVAWNGLISVNEAATSTENRSYYLDGVKYLQVPTLDEFQATLVAVHRPTEFAACDGVANGLNGLMITHQRRRPFGLSYRTLVGNDISGDAYGYRIHLIYNALAIPSQRNYQTKGSSVDPATYSWEISAIAPPIPNYKPTPHLIFDSLTSPPDILAGLEAILYGTDDDAPRLPLPAEIFDIGFGLIVTDNGDGTFTVTGSDDLITMLDSITFEITSPTAIFLDADTYTISSL